MNGRAQERCGLAVDSSASAKGCSAVAAVTEGCASQASKHSPPFTNQTKRNQTARQDWPSWAPVRQCQHLFERERLKSDTPTDLKCSNSRSYALTSFACSLCYSCSHRSAISTAYIPASPGSTKLLHLIAAPEWQHPLLHRTSSLSHGLSASR